MRAYCSFEATDVGIEKSALGIITRGRQREKLRTLEIRFSNQCDFCLGNIFGIFVHIFVIYSHFVGISYAVQVRNERLSSNNIGRIASIRRTRVLRVVNGKFATNDRFITTDESEK